MTGVLTLRAINIIKVGNYCVRQNICYTFPSSESDLGNDSPPVSFGAAKRERRDGPPRLAFPRQRFHFFRLRQPFDWITITTK